MVKLRPAVLILSVNLALTFLATLVPGLSHATEIALGAADLHRSIQGTEAAKPAVPLSSDGTMTDVTLGRTRASQTKGPPDPATIVWKSKKLFTLKRSQWTIVQFESDANGGVSRFQTDFDYSAPVATEDAIYFSLSVGDGFFYMLDSGTGEERKILKLRDVSVSPVAIAGDQAFFGTSDGTFRSVDRKTGQERWKVARKDYRFDVTSPVIAGGVLLFGGAKELAHPSRSEGTVHALEASTGRQIWMVKIIGAASSPAVHNGTVYFGDQDRHFFALDLKSGSEKWKLKASGNVRTHAASEGRVYFSAGGDLFAADGTTGRLLWRARKAGKVGTALAFDGNLIYYGGRDGFVYAVEGTGGDEEWRFKLGGACSAPVVAGGALYFASADQSLYSLDAATGRLRWKYPWQSPLSISPVISDGKIYVLDDAGTLSALR